MSHRIDPRLPLTDEIRRIAAAELETAVADLETSVDNPDAAVHKARKRLKSVRALLRLVRSADEDFFRAENARYRDLAAALAGPREAGALLETVDRLAEAFPEEAAGGGLAAVRDRLSARREAMLADQTALREAVASAVAGCHDGIGRLAALVLPDRPEDAADVLAAGAGHTLRRAAKALDRARREGGSDDFHELRKAVKAHAMHLSLLKTLWPPPVKARRKAIERLGEMLGELQDLAVLRALIDADDRPLGKPGQTRLLARLLKRSEKALRKACLDEAGGLLGANPRRQAKELVRHARGVFGHDASRGPEDASPASGAR